MSWMLALTSPILKLKHMLYINTICKFISWLWRLNNRFKNCALTLKILWLGPNVNVFIVVYISLTHSYVLVYFECYIPKISKTKAILTWNQSIVQQLISEGNCLSLLRNASPIGLMHNITCSFSLQQFTKKLKRANGENSIFLSSAWAWATGRTTYIIEQKIGKLYHFVWKD